MAKTIQEINEKIRRGRAVVCTAEEVIQIAKSKGAKQAAAEVDVVTTGTFAPMCSSGAYFNVGHSKPRIKLGGGTVTLNDVPVYTGFAAVDFFLGATAVPDTDPRNTIYPGKFSYGGGHLIEDLVAGKDVQLIARAYGTDCYPRRKLETWIRLEDMNEAVLFNMRNCYQNYNVAVNLSDRLIYTYMGVLQPNMRNATYCSAGQLSPLLNDPFYRTIGIGTRIFLGGGIGYVVGNGTQHNPSVPRTAKGIPRMGAGTLAVTGSLKQMSARWLRGASFTGYGVTLAVGIGIPIPILDEDMLLYTAVTDADIVAQVVDYSEAYPHYTSGNLAEVSYAELKSGSITVNGKKVPSAGLSSYVRAREIAEILKSWLEKGSFLLTEPAETLVSADSEVEFKPLQERPILNNNRVAAS
ncbi:MAG: homocysteine biosynthesis protein [Deltaproteobacteria bacterium]|nr:homocysteine biosynthesis protein [Deltaproteobacteria bacterium]MBW2070888.1 homocysteine biosynthesis protein [Deltaproteobacteria bacterium]